jgi:broad specificity phosphatase PhoE
MSSATDTATQAAPLPDLPVLALALATPTIVLIRHAEPAAAVGDPSLAPAGLARAKLLARMLSDASLKGVYVTSMARSAQTGSPSATSAGLPLTTYIAADATGLASAVFASHTTGAVLVVAHSNTVDDIAAAFGAAGVGELAHNQFDRMYLITRRWCGSALVRLRYGAATP